MRDTILFDLDGTLLPLNMDRFIGIYFKEMGIAFSDMIDPKKLVASVWAGTEAMLQNQESKTNEAVFTNAFMQLVPGVWETYRTRFEAFYETGFLKTRASVQAIPIVRECIEILKRKKYTLAIATNPVFPKRAVFHRIHWAGLSPDDFSYISHYEQNCFCKPGTAFYDEVLRALGKQPEQCIMAGNDVQEDLCAGELGIETFLINNHMIHRNNRPFECTYQGSYEDFYQYVEKLKPLV